jgi:DNA-binding MarR family transcriptional regulator
MNPNGGALVQAVHEMQRRLRVAEPAPPRERRDDIELNVGFALGVVFHSYTDAADEAIEEVPGGRRGYQVLVAATRDTPDSQAGLAVQLGVDTSTMVGLIDDLEYAGLVERRIDRADRRRRQIVATERGRLLDASVRKKMQLAEDNILRCFDSTEQQAFREMLGRLATRAREADATQGTADPPCADPDRPAARLDHRQSQWAQTV